MAGRAAEGEAEKLAVAPRPEQHDAATLQAATGDDAVPSGAAGEPRPSAKPLAETRNPQHKLAEADSVAETEAGAAVRASHSIRLQAEDLISSLTLMGRWLDMTERARSQRPPTSTEDKVRLWLAGQILAFRSLELRRSQACEVQGCTTSIWTAPTSFSFFTSLNSRKCLKMHANHSFSS